MNYEIISVDDSVGPIGAYISGVDLSNDLSDEVVKELKAAWYEHHVLFFRDQTLTPKQHAKFAANFGELDVYPFMNALEESPNVIPIIKEPDAELNFGGGWHTDTSYMAYPPMATLLYAIDVPDEGGDTLFADATTAYSNLSQGLKEMLANQTGVYSPKLVHGKGGSYKKAAEQNGMSKDYGGSSNFAESEVQHPLIRTHPETGEASIFCSIPHTHRISGWTREESIPIFKFLTQELTQEKYVTKFKWEKGTLAMWDNRCLFHYALNDYQGKRRHMHRVIVKGEKPR